MPEKNTILYDNSVELISITNEEIINNIADINLCKIAIFRLNLDNNIVAIPADKIDQFMGESQTEDIVFYIEKNWKQKVKKIYDINRALESDKGKSAGIPGVMDSVEKYGNTNEMIKSFQMMSIEEREEILDKSIEGLHEMRNKKSVIDIKLIVKMVDVIANTFYTNYANMEDNLSSENIKNNYHGIYNKTLWVIQMIIDCFVNNGAAYESYAEIDRISTGSYTIDNINKGLLWFIGFSLFYNDYIDKGLVTKKIRGEFKDKYSRYYRKRLNEDMTSIERIIKGGLKKIDVAKELPVYAVGALLYDIGKVPFIGYHDSNESYNENMVKMHVLVGYNMILKTKKYQFEIAAMAALHHEYYGGKGSYNFTNPIISKLNKKKRSDGNAQYFITYDEKEFRDGVALAFFPCKVIEIIDIYNALIHHKKNLHFDAMKIVKKNFITQSLKVDPLIFDIFLEFKQRCGFINLKERNEIDSIIY